MSENDKIQKLEETVKFLRKELESQNMAILRLERALETGEGVGSTKEKPNLSLADLEFVIFGIEEKLKRHNELIKNMAISLVGTTDLLEEVRDLYKTSVSEIKLDKEQHMKFFHKLLGESLETIRTEFLLVLRDFREKYPALEAYKIESELADNNTPDQKLPTRKLDSDNVWMEEQLRDLNLRNENIELFIEQRLKENMNSIFEMFNFLSSRVEEFRQIIMNEKIE